MDTTEIKNYPEVREFLDSIGRTIKQFDLKRKTDVRSSQKDTMYILDQIAKQNEMKKKREQLKLRVMKIEQETGIYTLNLESLLKELLKQDQVSVYAFLDRQESDLLS